MKIAIAMAGLVLIPLGAFAHADTGNVLSFVIDWDNSQSLNQGKSIECDPDGAKVMITAPGLLNRDFKVTAPGGTCKLKSAQENDQSGVTVSTTLTYEGEECYSDEDENFFVDQLGADGKPTGKKAAITADAGC